MSKRFPYPDNPGGTHYEGCWRDRGHHNCAVAELGRLRAEVERLGAAIIRAPCPSYPKGNTRYCALAFGDDRDCDCWKRKNVPKEVADAYMSLEGENEQLRTEVKELREAARQLSTDMHYPSDRPCRSCREMTEALGEPYGCYAYQAKRKALEADDEQG